MGILKRFYRDDVSFIVVVVELNLRLRCKVTECPYACLPLSLADQDCLLLLISRHLDTVPYSHGTGSAMILTVLQSIHSSVHSGEAKPLPLKISKCICAA